MRKQPKRGAREGRDFTIYGRRVVDSETSCLESCNTDLWKSQRGEDQNGDVIGQSLREDELGHICIAKVNKDLILHEEAMNSKFKDEWKRLFRRTSVYARE